MLNSSVLLAADFTAALANTAPWIWRDRAEHLPDVASLRRLLDTHGLTHDGLDDRDVIRARELRTALRVPFDADTDTLCARAIDELLAELKPIPRITLGDTGCSIRFRCPSGRAIDDATATAAYALAGVITTEGRRRLHHCAADRCNGVFLDPTRNRSRRYCMPELCGNRANVTAHRSRARRA